MTSNTICVKQASLSTNSAKHPLYHGESVIYPLHEESVQSQPTEMIDREKKASTQLDSSLWPLDNVSCALPSHNHIMMILPWRDAEERQGEDEEVGVEPGQKLQQVTEAWHHVQVPNGYNWLKMISCNYHIIQLLLMDRNSINLPNTNRWHYSLYWVTYSLEN